MLKIAQCSSNNGYNTKKRYVAHICRMHVSLTRPRQSFLTIETLSVVKEL